MLTPSSQQDASPELQAALVRLGFRTPPERLSALLGETAVGPERFLDFFARLLGEEERARHAVAVAESTARANLPFISKLDDFDFSFQPSIDRSQIDHLASCAFLEDAQNIIFIGPPGVGKTHLAVGLGLKAIEQGYEVRYTQSDEMMASLSKAVAKGTSRRDLKKYLAPDLLIIDDVGLRPLSATEASLFYKVIHERYERASVILTTPLPFAEWGFIADQGLAAGLLDRLLHRASVTTIDGRSYRQRHQTPENLELLERMMARS
jgi:DNA replication protein DnaC